MECAITNICILDTPTRILFNQRIFLKLGRSLWLHIPPPIFFVHALLARVVSNNEASRLEIIRNSFGSRGFPTGVVDLLLAGNHSNTNTAYESAWKNWGDWCLERNANPMSPNLMSIGIPTSPENDW